MTCAGAVCRARRRPRAASATRFTRRARSRARGEAASCWRLGNVSVAGASVAQRGSPAAHLARCLPLPLPSRFPRVPQRGERRQWECGAAPCGQALRCVSSVPQVCLAGGVATGSAFPGLPPAAPATLSQQHPPAWRMGGPHWAPQGGGALGPGFGAGAVPVCRHSPASHPTVPSWRDHVVEPLRDPNPSDILEVRPVPPPAACGSCCRSRRGRLRRPGCFSAPGERCMVVACLA